MKRVSSLFLALALFWGLFSIPVSVRAQDVDYTIEQYQVEVRMDRARRYVVTETIDVRFPSERQGIYRDLPLFGGEEDYNLHDISVEGAQYQLEPGGETLRIRIGTPGEYVTGMQRYVIRYTMDHAADGDSSYDHAYINLLGQGWECSIQRFSAAVQLPERPVRYQVFSGREGETGNPYILAADYGTLITLESKEALAPGTAVTLHGYLEEGAFDQAPQALSPLTVLKADAIVTLNRDRSYRVDRELDLELSEPREGVLVPLSPQGEEKTWILDVEGEGMDYDAEYGAAFLHTVMATGQQHFALSYTVDQELDRNRQMDYADLWLFSGTAEAGAMSGTLRVHLPEIPNEYRAFSRTGDGVDRELAAKMDENGALTVALEQLPAGALIGVRVVYPEGFFTRPASAGNWIALVAATALLVLFLVLYLLLGRERPLLPVPQPFPPKELNSAEAGYLINFSCSPDDIASLILQWAEEGHLTMADIGEDGFLLTRGAPLDDGHRGYEHTLYDALFALGDEAAGTVTDEQLKEKFYPSVADAQKAVAGEFTGEHRLEDRSAGRWSTLLALLAALFLSVGPLLGCLKRDPAFSLFGILPLVAGLLALWFSAQLYNSWHKMERHRRRLWSGLLGLFYLAFAGIQVFLMTSQGELSPAIAVGYTLVGVLCLALHPFIRRRSVYGRRLMEELLGLRLYLTQTDESSLFAMAREHPGYFYRLLPYAMVLGLEETLGRRFEGILTEPPIWYQGQNWNTMSAIWMVHYMNRSMSRMTQTMVSAPAPQGGGSGGFTGGGFSGSGFTGGGSGGGGGGAW